jgi:hypothetical protein
VRGTLDTASLTIINHDAFSTDLDQFREFYNHIEGDKNRTLYQIALESDGQGYSDLSSVKAVCFCYMV